MTDLHLNLLAPEKKQKFQHVVRFIFIKELLEIVIFTVSFLGIINLMALLVLTQTLTDLSESTLIVNRDQSTVEREVAQVNTLSKNVAASGQDYAIMTPKLLELFGAVSSTITLQAVDIDRNSNTVTVVGVADSRDALLTFEKVLGSISWIGSTSAPLSQLFQKTNISFEIHGTLKGFPPLRQAPSAPKPVVNVSDN